MVNARKSHFAPKETGTNFKFAKVSGAFKLVGFYEGKIDELKLLSDIRKSFVTDSDTFKGFDYSKYIEEIKTFEDYKREAESIGVRDNTRIDPSSRYSVANQIPDRKFNARLSKRKGNVRLKPGIQMIFDVQNSAISYHIFHVFDDAEKILKASMDTVLTPGKYDLNSESQTLGAEHVLAMHLNTPILEKFKAWVEMVDDSVKVDAYLSEAFYKVRTELIPPGYTNAEKLHKFYSNVPAQYLNLMSDADLYYDLTLLLRFDNANPFWDASSPILTIMKAFSDPSYFYRRLYKEPKEGRKIYDVLNSDEDREYYCNFITALSLVYQPVESTSDLDVFIQGPNYEFDSDLFFGKPDKIYLKNDFVRTVETPLGTSVYDIDMEFFSFETEVERKTTIDKYFNPLDLVVYQDQLTGESTIVSAIYIKHLSDLQEWEKVMSRVVLVASVISLFISIGVILRGAAGLIRFFAYVDIAISTIDIALENDDFKKYVEESSPAGEWFVKNWDTISIYSSLGIMSVEFAFKFFYKHGDTLIDFFGASKKQFTNVDQKELSKQMKQLKVQAKKVLDNLTGADAVRLEKLEKFHSFVNRWKGKSIKDIPFKEIIENLKGITKESSLVAELLEARKMHVMIIDDRVFEGILRADIDDLALSAEDRIKAIKNIKRTMAFAQGDITVYRASKPLKQFMSELVHEGIHVQDNLTVVDLKKNNWAQGAIDRLMGSKRDFEMRAYTAEREFQIEAGLNVDFPKIESLWTHVRLEY